MLSVEESDSRSEMAADTGELEGATGLEALAAVEAAAAAASLGATALA